MLCSVLAFGGGFYIARYMQIDEEQQSMGCKSLKNEDGSYTKVEIVFKNCKFSNFIIKEKLKDATARIEKITKSGNGALNTSLLDGEN